MTDTAASTSPTPAGLHVIPRDVHGISRKQMSPNALRVLYRLREAGFGGYLVGGAVRDLLVGGAPLGLDRMHALRLQQRQRPAIRRPQQHRIQERG